MTLQTSCPPDERLQDLFAGHLAEIEQAELTAHLEACSACQSRLEALAGGEAWVGAARHLAAAAPERGPSLEQALQRLKNEECKLETQTEPITLDNLALHFLSPSEQPGHLGCLDRYEITEVIGRGGMGVVLKAFDADLQRFVAIKVLAPQLATSEAARKRFAREARAAAAISHENVVAIHGVEESNGLPYLVMQHISGISLQERLDQAGPLEVQEIVRIGMQTALGLAAAHAQGLIHRDIKPANVLLQITDCRSHIAKPDDSASLQSAICNLKSAIPKITDFGLARAVDDATLTQSGLLAGTPQYMAPEQARGEPLDHRADLFSLGSVLYALCTGQPPFRADNTMAVLRRVSDDRPTPIQQIRPGLPDWLIAIIDKLHAKNPDDRFQSAAEVADLLGQYWKHLQQPAQAPLPQVSSSLIPMAKKGRGSMALVRCSECGKEISNTAFTCPHCGALRGPRGYEYRSRATLFGLPLIHVASGRDPATGRRRVAKGVIAIGDLAVGGLAIGGCSLGVISIGGCAFGLFSLGGLAVGLLVAFGGLGIGGLALGGIAIGILAVGGGAIGWYAACGGGATAVKYAVGGLAYAEHANDAAAQEFMESCLSWLGRAAREQSPWIVLVLCVCALVVVACIVKSRWARDPVES